MIAEGIAPSFVTSFVFNACATTWTGIRMITSFNGGANVRIGDFNRSYRIHNSLDNLVALWEKEGQIDMEIEKIEEIE
jgi:hypothetical protein